MGVTISFLPDILGSVPLTLAVLRSGESSLRRHTDKPNDKDFFFDVSLGAKTCESFFPDLQLKAVDMMSLGIFGAGPLLLL